MSLTELFPLKVYPVPVTLLAPNFRGHLSSIFVAPALACRCNIGVPWPVRLSVNNWLVSATPPTVFGQSFWNFTDVLAMACRCAYCLLVILRFFFFFNFFRFVKLVVFLPKTLIVSGSLVSATPPTVFGQSFWNFTDVLVMVYRCADCLLVILRFFFQLFPLC